MHQTRPTAVRHCNTYQSVSGERKAIGLIRLTVRTSVCFQNIFWTNWHDPSLLHVNGHGHSKSRGHLLLNAKWWLHFGIDSKHILDILSLYSPVVNWSEESEEWKWHRENSCGKVRDKDTVASFLLSLINGWNLIAVIHLKVRDLMKFSSKLWRAERFRATAMSSVLFFSRPRSVGCPHHGRSLLSPIIPVLCHSNWLFHGESCPRLDAVHPGRAWPSSPACTWHCSLHYLFLQATPLFPHGVTIVC